MSIALTDAVAGQLVDPAIINGNNTAIKTKFDPGTGLGGVRAADMYVVNHHISKCFHREKTANWTQGLANAIGFYFTIPYDHAVAGQYSCYINQLYIYIKGVDGAFDPAGGDFHFSLTKQPIGDSPLALSWESVWADTAFSTLHQYSANYTTQVSGPVGNSADKTFKFWLNLWCMSADVLADVEISIDLHLQYEHKPNPS